MRIQTQRLGAVEASPESFLTLPEGLIGFEDQKEFVLVSPESQAPFRWLLSFSNPELAFPVLDPRSLVADYAPQWTSTDRRALGAVESDVLDVLVLASVDAATRQLSVNLRAPIVIHGAARTAKQIVLSDGRWAVDHVLTKTGSSKDATERVTRQAA
jgi:flagellar assembly factor FliW